MIVRADLHIHSIASDGEAHPREIIKYALRRGIRVVAVTDHDTFLGSYVASKYVVEGVVSVFGAEVRVRYGRSSGDVLVLCDHVLSVPISKFKELENLVELGKAENCLLIPAHPYTMIRHGINGLALMSVWDGVEVFNGGNDPLANLMNWVALRGFRGPKLANSDAHVLEMIGQAHNIVEVEDLSIDEVLESIRRGAFKIYASYSLVGQVRRVAWGIKRKVFGIPWGRDLIKSKY